MRVVPSSTSLSTKPAADNFPIVELQIRNGFAHPPINFYVHGTRGGSGLDGLTRRSAGHRRAAGYGNHTRAGIYPASLGAQING